MPRPPSFERGATMRTVQRQFRKTGYAGTSLDDICAATGLGRGSVYGAFGGKHELFLMSLKGYGEQMSAALDGMLTGRDDESMNRLEGFLLAASRLAADDADHLGCMAGRFALELEAGSDVAAFDVIADVFATVRAALVAGVEGAKRNGDISADADAQAVACMILALSRGFDVVARGGVEVETLEAAARRAIASLPRTVPVERTAVDGTVPAR